MDYHRVLVEDIDSPARSPPESPPRSPPESPPRSPPESAALEGTQDRGEARKVGNKPSESRSVPAVLSTSSAVTPPIPLNTVGEAVRQARAPAVTNVQLDVLTGLPLGVSRQIFIPFEKY